MAPNVKETPNVIDALALLDVYNNKNNLSTTAFLPLTHPLSSQQLSQLDDDEEVKEECKAQAAAAATATATATATAEECNYWDWPCPTPEEKEEVVVDDEKLRKEEMMKQILHEEEIREMLSISHIEANLIKDAARRQEEEKEQLFVVAKRDDSSEEEEEYEGYWDMTPPEHDLSNEDFDDKKDNIVVAQHVKDATHPFHTYWDNWDTSPRSEKVQKEELIRQVLQDEQARRIVGLDALQERLIKDAENKSAVSADCTNQKLNSSDYSDLYWTWNTNTMTSTCSPTPPTCTTTTADPANDKYWDWPTLSPAEVKQRIIDSIVREEEIRQLLSIQHVEETELKKNRLSNGTHHDDDVSKLTTSTMITTTTTGNNANDSYWDW